MTQIGPIPVEGILRMLPHRQPFLLVDRVILQDTEQRVCEAIKNVTYNEPFFAGHFPGRPVMPGVLILEAMAQTAGLLAATCLEVAPDEEFLLYFAGIDHARFKRPVVPGDTLHMRAEVLRHKRDIWKFSTVARVDGELACSAEMMCSVQRVARTAR